MIFAVSLITAGWLRMCGSSQDPVPPQKQVTKLDTGGLDIATLLFGFTTADTLIDGKIFQRMAIPDEEIDRDTVHAGLPQIPFLRLQIAVPDSCTFNVGVEGAENDMVNDFLLYPVPRVVFDDSGDVICAREIYTYDTLFYEKDTLYPGKLYDVVSVDYWRDQRVMEVNLYPVQFNPHDQKIYFATGMELEIRYDGKVVFDSSGIGPFEGLARDILLNYPGIDRQPPPHPAPTVHYYTDLLNSGNIADYLIITHYDFLNNKTTKDWVDSIAQWRVDHNRFDVGVVKMRDIYNLFPVHYPDSAAQLFDFLHYAYDHWYAPAMTDGHLAYCLFIGDWDYVPARLYEYENGDWLGADEHYFADLLPGGQADIMLGRWPVKETKSGDLVTIVQKTLNYEKNPCLGDWRRQVLLIAGSDASWNLYVAQTKPYVAGIGYDTIAIRQSTLDAEHFKDSLNKYLNEGEILTPYWDHGDPVGWKNYDTTQLKTLENNGRQSVVLSNACLTAMFQWDHPFYDGHHSRPRSDSSFGELFLKKTNGGAVAFWGATVYSYIFPPELIFRPLFQYQNWILGQFAPMATQYCILGDPALDLGDYTAYPTLPDLVVRPQGIDIKVLAPYPYPAGGDIIPVQAKIYNIGAVPAYNVEVELSIDIPPTIVIGRDTISQILPRDTAQVMIYWNTGNTHPNFYGEIGNCKYVIKADPDNDITESWEGNNTSSIIKKTALYPYLSGWPKNVSGFSQPAIGNINNAGAIEIVYASKDSVYVFNYDGTIFSGWPRPFKGVQYIVLGDINADNYLEIVSASAESIKVFNYQGNILHGWPVKIPYYNIPDQYRITSLPSLGVISEAPGAYRDIIVPISHYSNLPFPPQYPIIVLVYNHNGGSPSYIFNSSTDVGSSQIPCVSIEDVCAGGLDEIVLSYFDREYGIEGTDIFNNTSQMPVHSYAWGGNMAPALVNVSGDNYPDVIAGCINGNIKAYNVSQDLPIWEQTTDGAINSSPAVGNIHPTSLGDEVTFGNEAGQVHLRRKTDGASIPPWSDTTTGCPRGSPALACINSDAYPDVITPTQGFYLYAHDYNKFRIVPYPLPFFNQLSSPVVGDINGDRKNELIIASRDGYLHVLKNTDSRVDRYWLDWPQFHHDFQRSGIYNWVP